MPWLRLPRRTVLLVHRYFGLGGVPAESLRHLASETSLTRTDVQRRLYQSVVTLIGPGDLGRPCVVCGLDFVPPSPESRRRTCGRKCEVAYHRQLGSHERLRAPARRQGREATDRLRKLDTATFDRLRAMDTSILRLYYGLEDGLNWTKRELADRFGLSVWRISEILRQSKSVLLDPAAEPPASHEVARRRRAEHIAEARRKHGRPSAEALRALASSALMHCRSSSL